MNIVGIHTGISNLDSLILGLIPGRLYVIASRPGMGKTSLAANICANVTMTSEKTPVFFSLDQSKENLVNYNILPCMAHVSREKLVKGRLNTEEQHRVNAAKSVIEKRIHIDDSPRRTVSDIKAQCLDVENLGLVIIDYLQLMHDLWRFREDRQRIVGEITRSLKSMATELNIPIIILSQFSAATECRMDKHPLLTDLFESGAIVQNTDVIIALYSESYYNDECEDPDDTEAIVLKNRYGETGIVHLRFIPEYITYTSN